ncbi:MFS transporter [Actinosynnema sp. NPDC047251]|uniref:Putative membrane protein n=1 Tax=Saccharothrix espanaensis (strain ATCC 51144 / DSM 44229 / JCM 9112 / NBRC 15066 / NRRL 15764) TaxID=1179773 RepID=K0JWF7_SACES|nr:MFS transporter [Saccharothrix espanaensis]CCH30386.1 putative membrane protein [Saccharothrix espanaensis DSM 44229]
MRRYLVAAGLARLADEMVGVAVVLLVLSRTGSVALSGAVVACYTVPSILSGPLLGAWLDRARRPVVALAGNQFVLAIAAGGLVAAGGNAPALLGSALLAGITLPMTSGGFTSLVPRLAVDVPRATSYDALLFNVAAIGGPALAGVVSAVWSPVVAMIVLGAMAFVGAVSTCGLRVPERAAADTSSSSLVAAMRRGLRHMATTPPLRGTTVASVLSLGAVGMFAPALPVHVASLGVDEGYAGLVWAVFEIGCVAGLLALRRHLDRWRPERVVFTAVALYGVTLAVWPLAGTFPVLLGLALVSGVAQGPTLTSTILARQRYTPAGLLGQVSTTGASLKLGAFAGGAALGGALVDRIPTASVILLVAAVQLAAAALGSITARQSNPDRVTP